MDTLDNIIRTRAEAKALGLKKYFTGKPCPQGHITDRYTDCSKCITCHQDYLQSDKAKQARIAFNATPERKEYLRQYARTPESKRVQKNGRLLREYNISLDQFEAMLQQQENKCACCLDTFDSSKKETTPHIDHCHATGKVRELLCCGCNALIGFAKEDVSVLKKAIQYVRRHNAP